MNEIEPFADAITKALAYTENGGKLDLSKTVAGKTGEMKSIFQFTPSTWKSYAKQTFGDENTPLNNDTETYVVHSKVSNWLKEGRTASEIASMWNAGESELHAHTGKFSTGSPSVGINKKYGVKYDVPSYAKKVVDYSKKFYAEKQGSGSMQGVATGNMPTNSNQQQSQVNPGAMQGIRTHKPKLVSSKQPLLNPQVAKSL